MLALPSSGLIVETHELPGLPASRALVLQSSLKTMNVGPYQSWLEQAQAIDQVVTGKRSVKIEVVH